MQTRKRRHTGGDILGKGAKGTVITVACNSGSSLCAAIQDAISANTLVHSYTNKKEKYRLQPDTLQTVLEALESRNDLVAKRFHGNREDFMNELEGLGYLLKIGDRFVDSYSSYATLPVKGKDFSGFQIGNVYYVLNKRCDTTVLSQAKTMKSNACKQLIHDILNVLVQYQKAGLYHNDIKMDNIMKCGDKYLLIDLEKMLDRTEMKEAYLKKVTRRQTSKPYGSIFTTSPLALYIFKKQLKTKVHSLTIGIPYTMIHKYPFTVASFENYLDFFEEHVIHPVESYLNQHSDMNDADLFERFVANFDVYAVGIVIAQMYFIQQGHLPETFLKFAECLINPLHPKFAGSAKEALDRLGEFF